jgi:hypothetical protein
MLEGWSQCAVFEFRFFSISMFFFLVTVCQFETRDSNPIFDGTAVILLIEKIYKYLIFNCGSNQILVFFVQNNSIIIPKKKRNSS